MPTSKSMRTLIRRSHIVLSLAMIVCLLPRAAAAVTISTIRYLDVGNAWPGQFLDVSPADFGAGEYLINGEPNAACVITAASEVTLTTLGGGPDREILAALQYSAGPQVVLDGSGNFALTVGCSIGGLSPVQETGSYDTNFTINVLDVATGVSTSYFYNAKVTLSIVRQPTISTTKDLDFGAAQSGQTLGTIAPTDLNAGEYVIYGQPNATYSLIAPSEITLTTQWGGPGREILLSLQYSAGPGINVDWNGEAVLAVGGSLATIPPGQVPGSYDTTFDINILDHTTGVTTSYSSNARVKLDVEPGATGVPAVARTAMRAASPNPFNPRTTITFELARDGLARLFVYNLRGECVRRLVDGTFTAGSHAAVWEGRDDAGRPVASGSYLVRLEALGVSADQSISLLK